MKIVIDTNVLIAAFISPKGRSSELLDYCASFHEIICSDFILFEFRNKLLHKFKRDEADVERALDLLKSRMVLVTPATFSTKISRDPFDDPILGTALAGNAESIITGDKDLLVFGNYNGIKITSPAEFLVQEKF